MAQHELHPLCTLFPRLDGDAFATLVAFEARRDDGAAIATFRGSSTHPGYWNFSVLDARSGIASESRKPIASDGVAVVLEAFGGLSNWRVSPVSERETVRNQCVRSRQPSGDVVYFLKAGPFVKIGTTNSSVDARVAQLRTGCPYEIKVLGFIDGGRDVEAALHKRFAGVRASGEWFHISPELSAYVRSIGGDA